MLEPLVVNSRVTIPGDELEAKTSRSSGPGGQHVNKLETAVELRFSTQDSAALSAGDKERVLEVLGARLMGEGRVLAVRSQAHRSQRRNLEAARERMAVLIREAIAPRKARRATKPTRGSQRRRLDSKKKRGDIKRQRRRNQGDD